MTEPNDQNVHEQRNLAQRLLAVIQDAGAVPKGGTAPRQTGGYAFHRIDDIVEHLRPHLVKHGVLVLPSLKGSASRFHVEETSKGPRTLREVEATIEITFINADDPGDTLGPLAYEGHGLDYSDKAPGKAFSYALKTGLLGVFSLRGQPDAEEDDHQRPAGRPNHAPPDNPADMVVPFGKKHKGKTIGTIWQSDPGYVEWLAKECNMDDVREAATEFLQQVKGSGKKTRTEQFEAAAKEAGWEADDAATQTGAWIKETFGAPNAGALSDEEFAVTLEWVRNAGSLPPDYLKEAELSDEVLEALSGAAEDRA